MLLSDVPAETVDFAEKLHTSITDWIMNVALRAGGAERSLVRSENAVKLCQMDVSNITHDNHGHEVLKLINCVKRRA